MFFGVSRLLPIVFDDSDAVPQTTATYKGGSLPSAGLSPSATDLAVPAKLPQATVGGIQRSHGVRSGLGRSYSAMPLRSSKIGGSNVSSVRMSSSRTISSSARSYSAGRQGTMSYNMGKSLKFPLYGGSIGLRTSSSALVNSVGGGYMSSVNKSYRGSRSSYSPSPISAVGSVGTLQVPMLAFSRSVNSPIPSSINSTPYSAAPRSLYASSFGSSGSRLSGYTPNRQSSLGALAATGGIADGHRIATMTRLFDSSRRMVPDANAAWSDSYYTQFGTTPTEEQLTAYINYWTARGYTSPPPPSSGSGLGGMDDYWRNEYYSEFGKYPTDEELLEYVNYMTGNVEPDPTPEPLTPTGLGGLYDQWLEEFYAEYGRYPNNDEELQAFIDYKTGNLEPDPTPEPLTPTGLGGLYDQWLEEFYAENGRYPKDEEELQDYIDYKTGKQTPVGDGIWLLLIFAVAMLVRRMAKKKQMVIDNKSLT